MSPDRNTIWARVLVDELVRSGLREAVIAPGSRSTPVVLALHDHPAVRTWTHLDERSAAFFALGMGKAGAGPAAVVTTSGTAVANLYPAVVEAASSETPLLLLSADRPRRLRGSDANQTIDQLEIFGRYTRAFFDLADPVVEEEALLTLREAACRAVAATREAPAGPVHLNVPFDKPLEPVEGSTDVPEGFGERAPLAWEGRPDGAPFLGPVAGGSTPESGDVEAVAALLRASGRGLVVAGPVPDPWRVGPALRRLSRATGYPLLPDPLSGGRYGAAGGAQVVGAYDLLLRQEGLWEELAPEVVVRVGRAPTSAALGVFLGWAARGRVDGSMGGGPPTRIVTPPRGQTDDPPGLRTILLDAGGRWRDHLELVTDRIAADPASTLESLAASLDAPPADPEWAARWMAVDEVARRAARDHLEIRFSEGTVLMEAAAAAGSGAGLFVGSSMPVRDLDAFGWPREEPLVVVGNRGASGIDGSTSTALGVSVGLGSTVDGAAEPVVAVLGDVAFLHDLNGLLVHRQVERPVVLVVIQNDGGGIFHMLPIRAFDPPFTRHFATPHGIEIGRAATLHGIPHERIAGADGSPPSPPEVRNALCEAIRRAREEGGTRILEIVSDREENRRRHEEVVEAVREALG